MLLNPTNTEYYRSVSADAPGRFGYLITPRKRGIPAFLREGRLRWGGDNDCYSGSFDSGIFIPWVYSLVPFAALCLFMAAPDVLANWKETLKCFPYWAELLRLAGFPVALVLQDGARAGEIPWDSLDAVFVGGSVDWKLSPAVLGLLDEAGAWGKWRHVGKVNSIRRARHFMGYAESFDGTFFVRSPDRAVKRFLPFLLGNPLPGGGLWR